MLAAGLLFSIFTFVLMQRMEFKSLRQEFIINTENYAVALKKSIDGNINALHAIEGLYASSRTVSRAEFRSFVGSILSHSDGIHSLRWVPRVAAWERSKYETAAVRDGLADYHFAELNSQKKMTPAAKRNEYFPIYFAEPFSVSELVLGLDLSASPKRRSSLEKARDTGAAIATSRITLLQESGQQFSFVVLHPIYRYGFQHNMVQERRKHLLGYAVGVFRFGDMVDAALRGIKLRGVEISLSDDSAPPEKRQLYSNVQQNNLESDVLNFTKTLNVADRKWTVKFHSTPEYLSTHKTPYAWVILAAGLILSFLLSLYVFKMKRHTLETERSKDTIATVLNSIDAAIAIIDSKDMRILAVNNAFIRKSEVRERQITGKRCDEIISPGHLPCDRFCEECPVTVTIRTGQHCAREIIHGADGSKRHIEVNAYPVRDETGSAVQVVHVAQDVTERKLAENVRLEEQQVRRMSAERQAVQTQLRMLQAQIEPHFLFNTLANIISLIDKEPKSAKEMLQLITKSLRLSLQRSREDVSTIGQEAEMLRDYLSIFKMRLGPRLEFIIEIPNELLELPFPPMLLQPLVENAIKHGIEPKVEGGRITIRAGKSEGLLRLSVSDTGLGFSEVTANGLGLENVKARLQALYKNGAGLILEENIPCGATATIEVPL